MKLTKLLKEIKLNEVKPFVDNQLRKKWSYPKGDKDGLVYLATNDRRYPTELVIYNTKRDMFHFMHSQSGKWSNPTQENVPANKLSSTHWAQEYFEEWKEDMDYEKGFYENKVNEGTKSYEVGDMWSEDFDYIGLLKFGAGATYDLGLETLQALFESFQDVNYHREGADLGNAIDWMEDPGQDASQAQERIEDFLARFRKKCAATLDVMGVKWTPGR
jgi:hypothetical protein